MRTGQMRRETNGMCGPDGGEGRGVGRRQSPERSSYPTVASYLASPESPLGSHSPGFLLFADDLTARWDTFMSCDHVDTLLWPVCLCVCFFLGGGSDHKRGVRRGGMSGQIPGFRATSGRGARPKPQAAREWTKGTFSCDAVSRGGVAFAIISKIIQRLKKYDNPGHTSPNTSGRSSQVAQNRACDSLTRLCLNL